MKTTKQSGIDLIAAERERQITVEGRTPERDKNHVKGELAGAAACYALKACGFTNPENIQARRKDVTHTVALWPWSDYWWKPTTEDPIRNLVKAGALIAAEIDRLQAKEEAP